MEFLKKIFLPVLLLFLIPVISYKSNSTSLYAGKDFTAIDLTNVKSFSTGSGMKVFYIRDELPQLTIVVSAGFGTLYEDRSNAGISDLVARTLSLGGSGKYPNERLHQAVESIGGRIKIFSSWERTIISLRVLKKHSDLAFDIVRDLLANPKFDNKHLEIARSLLLEKVRRKRDKPFALAFSKAREIIFNGKGYGAVMTEKSLKSVSRDDIMNAWKRYFTAANMTVGIVTSIDLKRIKENLSIEFGLTGSGKKMEYPSASGLMKDKSGKIYLIPKDIPQATIVLGTTAPVIRDGSIYSLSVMNYILGGGSFNSRLMKEIRVKRGLAYTVHSTIRFRKNTGVFLAYAQTNNDKADITLSLLLDNIRRMKTEKILPEELSWAKEAINNSYIFEFDNSLNILSKYISIYYNEQPVSFMTNYLKRINRVNREKIFAAGGRLFRNGLVKVVVGKRELKKKLERFGKVEIVD